MTKQIVYTHLSMSQGRDKWYGIWIMINTANVKDIDMKFTFRISLPELVFWNQQVHQD